MENVSGSGVIMNQMRKQKNSKYILWWDQEIWKKCLWTKKEQTVPDNVLSDFMPSVQI